MLSDMIWTCLSVIGMPSSKGIRPGASASSRSRIQRIASLNQIRTSPTEEHDRQGAETPPAKVDFATIIGHRDAMTSDDITGKLQAWRQGDRGALEELLPFLLGNMRGIARRLARDGATLNTTALVNETYLRLAGSDLEITSREHFLALVARAMRHILIDHARTQRRLKRGAGMVRVTLTEDVELTGAHIEQLLEIDDLLRRLETENPRRCQTFEMRFFAGLTVQGIAEALQVSERTVVREYRLACAWLRFHFAPSGQEPET